LVHVLGAGENSTRILCAGGDDKDDETRHYCEPQTGVRPPFPGDQ
jgi:hypothetical protein